MASRRKTGGVVDCGTAKEDNPETWETPILPNGKSGCGASGDPAPRNQRRERA